MCTTIRPLILLLLAAAGLCLTAIPLPAAPPGPWQMGRYPLPPSYFGYPLDDSTAGYYGGSRYREYYSFGRGYGAADFPDSLPPYNPYALGFPIRYRPSSQTPPHSIPLAGHASAQDAATAQLLVRVPADADVWLEGRKTAQTGTTRLFVSPRLVAGQDYLYEVRARWREGERDLEQVQKITVHPGERFNVTFPSGPDSEMLPRPNLFPLATER